MDRSSSETFGAAWWVLIGIALVALWFDILDATSGRVGEAILTLIVILSFLVTVAIVYSE